MKTMTKAKLALASIAFTLSTSGTAGELIIDYPYPGIFKKAHEEIANEFMRLNPDIEVKFGSPAADYEQANQRILLNAVTGRLPDVSFQALNRLRPLIDRGVVTSLNTLAKGDQEWDSLQIEHGLLKATTFDGEIYGIPFAVSTPIVYLNTDLLEKAGVTAERRVYGWAELFEMAKKVNSLNTDAHGFRYDWDISGNWLWQALVFSHGGSMMNPDETKISFDQEPGIKSIRLLGQMYSEAGMRDISYKVALQDFIAGKLAIWVETTAFLGNVNSQVGGRFKYITTPFPLNSENAEIPTGGNAAVILSKDEDSKRAAWKYLKFLMSDKAATILVRNTGYFSLNKSANANPEYLETFYTENPNYATALSQLKKSTSWYAFPGKNGLKITDVINDALHLVATGKSDPDKTLNRLASDVQKLVNQ